MDNFKIYNKVSKPTEQEKEEVVAFLFQHLQEYGDKTEDGNIIRADEGLKLDDEFDDTFGEVPEGYVVDDTPSYVDADELVSINGMEKEAELQQPEPPKPVEVKKEELEDEWGF